MPAKNIYRITFVNRDKLYEIYARHAGASGIPGFVQVSELLFGEKSAVVVDPSEESLRSEFKSVRQTHIPIHAIVRIDEVEKQGIARIREAGHADNVRPFPLPNPEPPKP
jgi:hypothetical protein